MISLSALFPIFLDNDIEEFVNKINKFWTINFLLASKNCLSKLNILQYPILQT